MKPSFLQVSLPKMVSVVIGRCIAIALTCAIFLLPVASVAQSLANYYLFYVGTETPGNLFGVRTKIPPQLRTTGDAPEPYRNIYFSEEYPFDTMRFYFLYMGNATELWLFEPAPARSVCSVKTSDWLKITPATLFVGASASVKYQFANAVRYGFECGGGSNLPVTVRWTMQDFINFKAPVRRKAIDGGAFDASPMQITREGVPWMTYYWGYRLGMVESQSDWDEANRGASTQFATWHSFPTPSENFALTTLPPPFVEGEVTEYVNVKDFPKQPGGQYFYAARQADRVALDAIVNWQRTGRAFNAGGYVNVCRFYGGGKPGGPNTHFFTADDKECALLKTLPFLDFEGTPFVADLPIAATNISQAPTCKAGTRPLYRAYNNAYTAAGKNDWQSNHRFVTNKADVDAMVAIGWADEGVAMCVPVLP